MECAQGAAECLQNVLDCDDDSTIRGAVPFERAYMDKTFIEELASAAPTPGGGGASAYAGALASALASMVGNLTVGKKAYASVEAEVYVVLEKLSDVRERLLELVEEDARAFEPLVAAYKMPKTTPEEAEVKEVAMQAALVDACEVPLEIMRNIEKVISLTDFLAYNGSRMVLSDAGVAATFARAAMEGASLNIFINAASLSDSELAARYCNEAEALVKIARVQCDGLFAYVKEAVS